MPKYWVSIPVWASVGMEVEAENEDAAIEIAADSLYPTLCHHCSHEVELGEPDYDKAEAEEID